MQENQPQAQQQAQNFANQPSTADLLQAIQTLNAGKKPNMRK
jgi:hypothetical protein